MYFKFQNIKQRTEQIWVKLCGFDRTKEDRTEYVDTVIRPLRSEIMGYVENHTGWPESYVVELQGIVIRYRYLMEDHNLPDMDMDNFLPFPKKIH